jgi:ribosomal protein S3
MDFSVINPLILKTSSNKKFGIQFLNSLSNFYVLSNQPKNSTSTNIQINSLLKQFILYSKLKKMPYSIMNNSSWISLNNQKPEKDLKYIKNLERNLADFFKTDMSLIPFFVNFEWQDAGYFADEIVYLLERRVSFRQLKNKILKQLIYNPHIQGVRITCSGRVGGKSKKAQRAKVDSLKYGETSLHVFSSKIDFAHRTAHTPLGSSGIKVWICYK